MYLLCMYMLHKNQEERIIIKLYSWRLLLYLTWCWRKNLQFKGLTYNHISVWTRDAASWLDVESGRLHNAWVREPSLCRLTRVIPVLWLLLTHFYTLASSFHGAKFNFLLLAFKPQYIWAKEILNYTNWRKNLD
jgi:hypothetical protein